MSHSGSGILSRMSTILLTVAALFLECAGQAKRAWWGVSGTLVLQLGHVGSGWFVWSLAWSFSFVGNWLARVSKSSLMAGLSAELMRAFVGGSMLRWDLKPSIKSWNFDCCPKDTWSGLRRVMDLVLAM